MAKLLKIESEEVNKDQVMAKDNEDPCPKKKVRTVYDIFAMALGDVGMAIIPEDQLVQWVEGMHRDKNWEAEGHFEPQPDDLGLKSATIMSNGMCLHLVTLESFLALLEDYRKLKQ